MAHHSAVAAHDSTQVMCIQADVMTTSVLTDGLGGSV